MQIYQKTVLEHSRSPLHFGSLELPTHMAEGFNPLCGDKTIVYLRTDGLNLIIEASHETSGCAICMSSASMMMDQLQSSKIKYAENLRDQISDMLKNNTEGSLPEMPLRSLEGLTAFPSRIKCATLPWDTLMAALSGKPNTTTEQEA
jgi:nitrogen fixation protein NifU and related proteins